MDLWTTEILESIHFSLESFGIQSCRYSKPDYTASTKTTSLPLNYNGKKEVCNALVSIQESFSWIFPIFLLLLLSTQVITQYYPKSHK